MKWSARIKTRRYAMNIILPKHYVDARELSKLPFFYLIGPVLGGGDWQVQMFLELWKIVGECFVAIPCRWDKSHQLRVHFAGKTGPYKRQLEWEQCYIQLALTRKRSCSVCWLAEESLAHRRLDGNPYGRDTYGEPGYFRGLLRYDRGLKIVIGAESGFPGLDVIRRNFDDTYKKTFPFEDSIAATAAAAVRKMG